LHGKIWIPYRHRSSDDDEESEDESASN